MFKFHAEAHARGTVIVYTVHVCKMGAAKNAAPLEVREYDEDLALFCRSVLRRDARLEDAYSRPLLYVEYYVQGVLFAREHFRPDERDPDDGLDAHDVPDVPELPCIRENCWYEGRIAEVERFPLPRKDFLSDSTLDKLVRHSAVFGLDEERLEALRFASSRVTAALRRSFDIPLAVEAETWIDAFDFLAERGDRESIQLLFQFAVEATSALGKFVDPEEACWRDPSAPLDSIAAMESDEWRRSRDAFVAIYNDPGSPLIHRIWCLHVFGESGDPAVLPLIADAVKSKQLGKAAIRVLHGLSSPWATMLVEDAVNSDIPEVAKAAAEAIEKAR